MRKVLVLIVLAQFLCTSLWFAGNAVFPDLIISMSLAPSSLGYITGAVQLGFISGTLLFALFNIPDRYSPSKVFFISAILAAGFNLAILLPNTGFSAVVVLRFLTGFSLAGIYPIGMKIAADYFDKGLGASLGFLVGALVLGTAFPHLIRSLFSSLVWQNVLYTTSAAAVLGGILILIFVKDGPYRKAGTSFQWKTLYTIFKNSQLRNPAMGYFGHMWELYAFWTFLPMMIAYPSTDLPHEQSSVSFITFLLIASGSLACVISGLFSAKWGPARIATVAVSVSMVCCLVSPWALMHFSYKCRLVFLLLWAMSVVADSPMFSTIVAHNAPPSQIGTALTIINSIGFGITIISILFLQWMMGFIHPAFLFLFLN